MNAKHSASQNKQNISMFDSLENKTFIFLLQGPPGVGGPPGQTGQSLPVRYLSVLYNEWFIEHNRQVTTKFTKCFI